MQTQARSQGRLAARGAVRFVVAVLTLARTGQASPPDPAPPVAASATGLARALRSVVLVQGERGPGHYQSGSGVVVAPGTIATNAHVVRDANRIRVLKDGRVWIAEAQCLAADQDLVLLRLPGLPLPVAEPAAPALVQAGTPVVAIGYPGGQGPHREAGRITGLWAFRGGRLVQTDTHCRPGSSGGGLFTEDGRLLGITSFGMDHGGPLDFAAPVDWVTNLVQDRLTSQVLTCPLVVAGSMLKDFGDLMVDDPDNLSQWEGLTHRWVQAAPGDPKGWFARGTALDLGMRARVEARVQEAIAAYRRSVALDPSYAKAWNNLGVDLDLDNQTQEALAAFRRATRLRPDYALAWFNLGACCLGSGAFAEARAALREGLALAGDNALAWARLGYCEARLGDTAAALRHYRLALTYAPFHPEWWGDLYLACLGAGQSQEAEHALERVRALAPDLAKDLARESAHPRPHR